MALFPVNPSPVGRWFKCERDSKCLLAYEWLGFSNGDAHEEVFFTQAMKGIAFWDAFKTHCDLHNQRSAARRPSSQWRLMVRLTMKPAWWPLIDIKWLLALLKVHECGHKWIQVCYFATHQVNVEGLSAWKWIQIASQGFRCMGFPPRCTCCVPAALWPSQ